MTWQVVLDGNPDDFDAIADEFVEPELTIVKRAKHTERLLCSTTLDAHPDLERARIEAQRLVELASGITRAIYGLDEPFGIVELRSGTAIDFAEARRRNLLRVQRSRGAIWAALANNDPHVDRVIRAFADPSWLEYRLIVDTIEATGCSPVERGWAFDRELHRLKSTCDSFTTEAFRPAQSAMMPRAAASLVARLVERWVDQMIRDRSALP
jgi:hypothetical protein